MTKKVCLFWWQQVESFGEFEISHFDPNRYFSDDGHLSVRDFLANGWNGYSKRRAILAGAAGIDKLYRQRDRAYMQMIDEFVERYRDYDLIVMAYNFVHPDILTSALRKPIKILGFIDDPYTTFQRGTAFLWAFDGAFHISPSYNEHWLFPEAFEHWGCRSHYWWPLVQPFDMPDRSDEFFLDRDIDLVYVGNPHPDKLGRLVKLKAHFGSRFRVHGRWRFFGFDGWSGALGGKPVFWRRVTPLSVEGRASLYRRAQIGFNMHVSAEPTETGNMRMYELPAHGIMQICDKAGCNAHEKIFAPGEEAVYYDNMAEAIELIEYYVAHPQDRIRIAKAAYARSRRDYDWLTNLRSFLEWGLSVRDRRQSNG
jgi:hypothetical protein